MRGPNHRGEDVEEGQHGAPQQDNHAVAVDSNHAQQHIQHMEQQWLNRQDTGNPQDNETPQESEQNTQARTPGGAQAEEEDDDWDPTNHHGDKMQAKQDQQVRVISV